MSRIFIAPSDDDEKILSIFMREMSQYIALHMGEMHKDKK